jgi:GNAT superfamily N-acetyltransferase
MRADDIPAGLRLCRLANWNQVEADWRFFLTSSPRGCRVAVDDAGNVIGTVATIAYGEVFSWIGMVLVDPQYRRGGIGTRLLHDALALLGKTTTARLDATPAGRNVYVPLGFQEEYGLQRMVRQPTVREPTVRLKADTTEDRVNDGSVHLQVDLARPMSDADFADVANSDRGVFGADRRALLARLRDEGPEYAWAIGEGHVDGYLFGRHGHTFEHLGPLAARDEETARQLVAACLSAHADRSFMIDVPDGTAWTVWLESRGFALQRPFMRMRRGEPHVRERLDRMFAIAGPEFG